MIQRKQNTLRKRQIGKPYFQYLGEIVEQVSKYIFRVKWDFLYPPGEKEGEISKKTYRYNCNLKYYQF